MHFQYGIYNSPIPAAFARATLPTPTPPPSPQRQRIFQAYERLMLVVTSEIATGATGTVHRGTVEVELPGESLLLDVVVKLAFSDQQQERLAHEDAIYRSLSSKHITGIPAPLGLFSSFDDGPSALLMTYRGVSISSSKQILSPVGRSVFNPPTLLLYVDKTIENNFLTSCRKFTKRASCTVIFAVRIFLLMIVAMPPLSILTGQ
jgi:hypothetical protein